MRLWNEIFRVVLSSILSVAKALLPFRN